MIRLILALIATRPLICSAEIYKWTDENDRVHFGDNSKDKGKTYKTHALAGSLYLLRN